MSGISTKEAAALLRRKDDILILTHRRPDGDTTGCAAGLCLALRKLGKTAWLLKNPDMTEINGTYVRNLWAPADFTPGFVVSVDIAARSLFFPAAEAYFDRIGLAVDHHPSFEGFGEAQCVNASCAACGEIVYEICRELGEISPEIALPLYAAVATDTGCFVYANTTANTHRTAAALLETGIDYFAVNKRHFRTKTRISQTDCASIVGIGKVLLEVIHGKFVYSKHLFAFRSLATFFFAFLPLLNFDVIFVSKPAQCLLIRHLLEFHKKIDRSTAFAATEAFANAFRF